MSDTLQGLNLKRRAGHRKQPEDERFLLSLNERLQQREVCEYEDHPERFPFIFVFGLPRSGTTLLSQVVAHSFDVGFVNNLMARFWLAPVTGIKLSRILLGDVRETDFGSNYATTKQLTDIHEFGYFWRYWLNKEGLADFINVRAAERHIDWLGLKRTLLNVQHEFGTALVFKNIFGAYHIERFIRLLKLVLFVYIERDPLDTAISILEARKRFYKDPDLWWSTCPLEYERLEGLPYMEQIGGQVHYLRRFYDRQIKAVHGQQIVRVGYQQLCENPFGAMRAIQRGCRRFCDFDLPIISKPPARFEYRQHLDQADLRDQFKRILEQFASADP